MAQPLPPVVKQPGGPNEYLAYLSRPEMQHLRSNPAAPYDERLPDKGPLNTFRGVPLFWGGEGPGNDGQGFGGDSADSSAAGGGYDSLGDGPNYGGWNPSVGVNVYGNPGDDARASEGGGEPRPAATGTRPPAVSITGPVDSGTDTSDGDEGTGKSDAELMAERINDALNAISSLFSNRQGVYDKLRDSSYALSQSGIADAYQRASRKLGFQMLRQGQDTGQVDIDLRSDLSKLKNDSLADAMRHAQGLSEGLRTKDSAKRAGLNTQALSGRLDPGQVGGMAGTFSAGVPQSWGGIADIGWNIPSGFAPGGGGGFMPNWKDMGNATPYFGASS